MATIDQLDISIYNLYAVRTMMIEQINEQLQLDKASSIPPQTLILDIYPRMTELDILLGVAPLYNLWGYFFPPKTFRATRRPPFAFSRIAPSLGAFDEDSETFKNLDNLPCHNDEEKKEKQTLKKCLAQIETINGWLGFIVGRIGQFLQG